MRRRSNEPLFWSLFGLGGVVTALVLPALILVTGIAGPLGLLGADALDYRRVLAFAGSWAGRLFFFCVISLTFWHTFHRIHHLLHDLGVNQGRRLSAVLFYGLAALGTVVTLVAVGRIG